MFSEIALDENRKKVAIDKVNELINKRCNDNGIVNSEIEVKFINDFIFAVSHTEVKSSDIFNVYGFYCFSYLAIDLYYYTSNVTPKDNKYTIDNVVSNTKNFFSHISKELSEL